MVWISCSVWVSRRCRCIFSGIPICSSCEHVDMGHVIVRCCCCRPRLTGVDGVAEELRDVLVIGGMLVGGGGNFCAFFGGFLLCFLLCFENLPVSFSCAFCVD